MLAYVFWHWKQPGISSADYEARLRRFHESLVSAPSSCVKASASFGIADMPWVNAGAAAYEDWYVMSSSADLDTLNDAAITAARQIPHDAAAAAAAGGTAGLYRLRLGAAPGGAGHAGWFAKPGGWSYAELLTRLRPVIEDAGASLWGRQMTLGPGREFCLVSEDPLALPEAMDVLWIPRRGVFLWHA